MEISVRWLLRLGFGVGLGFGEGLGVGVGLGVYVNPSCESAVFYAG